MYKLTNNIKTFLNISIYLFAFVLANLLVLWYGDKALFFNALFLIPFDFVMRCIFHEKWKGMELVIKFGSIIIIAGLISYFINRDIKLIATASVIGFASAQIIAGIFYQFTIKKSYFIKVNGSDFFGIIVDSILFQLIAFSTINLSVTIGQTVLKIIGGLFWYWLFFVKLRIQKKLN